MIVVEYDGNIFFHDKNYTIFCQLNNNFKLLNFGQSDFTNEKSLFYLDNISTESFHLYKIVEAEVKTLLPTPEVVE